jgi:hypothetical protein
MLLCPISFRLRLRLAAAATPAYLASLPEAALKNTLGEQLYKLISATNPSQAGKITGMLLELDTLEVLHLIETPAALADKVCEAVEALKEAATTQEAANKAEVQKAETFQAALCRLPSALCCKPDALYALRRRLRSSFRCSQRCLHRRSTTHSARPAATCSERRMRCSRNR